MSVSLRSIRVFLFALVCVLIVAALPQAASSQEAAISISENSTTSTPSLPIEMPPYRVEELVGGDGNPVGDFVVGPGKVELTILPGESKTVMMTVANRIGETHDFRLSVEDAEGSKDINQPIVLLGADRGPYSLKDYISFPHAAFSLGSNMRASIPVTITIPKDAEPGGRYGSVLIETVTASAEELRGENPNAPASAVVSRIGTLFFITIPGDVEKEGSLTDLSIIPNKHWFSKGPINFGVTFENTGSMHLLPYGEIHVNNFFGEEVGFMELEPWFTLPESIRLREVSWNREFLLGKYTATANLNRGYDDVVDTKTVTFWVIPWKIILGVFVGVFVFVYILRMLFGRFEFRRKT